MSCLAASACDDDGGGHSPDAAPTDDVDAGTDATDAGVPRLFNRLPGLSDEEVSARALALIGTPTGEGGRCSTCHSISAARLSDWHFLGGIALAGCLDDPEVSSEAAARRMADCLRTDASDPSSPFVAERVGWLSAAAELPWFAHLFARAYGEQGATELARFRQRAGMPAGGANHLTQDEFDVVAEWFLRDLPRVDELLPTEPPPSDCTTTITPALVEHVAAMKTGGWAALNRERGLLMFGCQGARTAKECLATYPRAADRAYGKGWESLPGAKLRILRENSYQSHFWTRSSADGRFVAHGGGPAVSRELGSAIIDLQGNRVIPTAADFDPGFFPDNSGFVFQAETTRFCNQSILTASPASVSLHEPGCSGVEGIGLYQHLGAGLAGKDYWAINSSFESDNGGLEATLDDPRAFFIKEETSHLTRMVHTGSGYEAAGTYDVKTPYEGDGVIAPSGELFVSRLAGPANGMRGYSLRAIRTTPRSSGGLDVEVPEVARYCIKGGKPSFSFDERFMVLHHYVTAEDAVDLGFSGPDDPAFAPYLADGAANIYVVDLTTGARVRVTRMAPGQYALFPHFRSDGWVYFMVRTLGRTDEVVVASDAALVLEAP